MSQIEADLLEAHLGPPFGDKCWRQIRYERLNTQAGAARWLIEGPPLNEADSLRRMLAQDLLQLLADAGYVQLWGGNLKGAKSGSNRGVHDPRAHMLNGRQWSELPELLDLSRTAVAMKNKPQPVAVHVDHLRSRRGTSWSSKP